MKSGFDSVYCSDRGRFLNLIEFFCNVRFFSLLISHLSFLIFFSYFFP